MGVPKTMPETVRLVLKSIHRELGTFPLAQFPNDWISAEPKLQDLILIDPAGRELQVWVNHEARLIYNFFDWWFEQPVESVDQVMELLTGAKAGKRGMGGKFPPGSINARVEQRLAEFSRGATTSGRGGWLGQVGENGLDRRFATHQRREQRGRVFAMRRRNTQSGDGDLVHVVCDALTLSTTAASWASVSMLGSSSGMVIQRK